jgi:hypothetical protein
MIYFRGKPVTEHEHNVRTRPTDMLARGLSANRAAAKGRDARGRKLFCHVAPFRPYFVREMLWMRDELRARERAPNWNPKE